MKRLTIGALCALFPPAMPTAKAEPQRKKQPPRQKVTICHVNRGKRSTIRVNEIAVGGHLARGDYQGACRPGM